MNYSAIVCAVVMAITSLAFGEVILAVVLVAVAVVSQVFGQSLIAFGLARLSVAFIAVSLLIQPLIAASLAWVFLNEAIGPIQGIGAVAVLAGILLARRASAWMVR